MLLLLLPGVLLLLLSRLLLLLLPLLPTVSLGSATLISLSWPG